MRIIYKETEMDALIGLKDKSLGLIVELKELAVKMDNVYRDIELTKAAKNGDYRDGLKIYTFFNEFLDNLTKYESMIKESTEIK